MCNICDRFNIKMDGPGLGYSYHLPSAGWNFRVRNVLAQFSDLFSEFNKYIAPAYHHDRCERYLIPFIFYIYIYLNNNILF